MSYFPFGKRGFYPIIQFRIFYTVFYLSIRQCFAPFFKWLKFQFCWKFFHPAALLLHLSSIIFSSAHHFPLVAEAESTDVLRLGRLVGSSGGGGVNVEERRRRSVARLSIVKPLAQEQDVSQVADVAAGQT